MSQKNLNSKIDKLVSLAKRRGFVYQSSEIYGGLNSCYDYGPLGVEMKNNIKNSWWRSMVYERDDIEGLDSSILMHPRVWEASGHVEGFSDPMIDCRESKARYRLDKISVLKSKKIDTYLYAFQEHENKFAEKKIKKAKLSVNDFEEIPLSEIDKSEYNRVIGPDTDKPGTLTEPRNFNLMFKTFMGAVEDKSNIIYMRPETAQGIYVNFQNVRESSRKKIPFGIAQIGKAFRNEITPGNFIFRTREFEQMEMQYFVDPEDDNKWFDYWKQERMNWLKKIGIRRNNLVFHKHEKSELAHYAKNAYDINYNFPFGWQEIEGIHNRTDYDLTRHQEYSKKDLRYFDDRKKEKYLPYIIETSVGCDRTLLTLLIDAFHEEEDRIVLKLNPRIAPIKAAVFPLVNKEGMPEIARNIYTDIKNKYKVVYDESGSIGRRYRRQDEAGSPYCITVDGNTVNDNKVTIRERDTMKQIYISTDRIKEYLIEILNTEK